MQDARRLLGELRRQLGLMPMTRAEAESILRKDVSGFRSSLLALVTPAGATQTPAVTNSTPAEDHVDVLATLLGDGMGDVAAAATPMSSSTQASFTFSFTFSDSTDGGSGGGGAPTPTSSLLETSLRELNLSTSALDPPSTLTPSSSESSIALPPFGVVSAVASADAETTITTRGFRFTQMVHNDWDPRTRNQLLVIRHVYLEQREALVARLTDAWQQMRAEFTRNDTLLPISQATMEDLDKSITSLISHTILLLQYHALGRVFELAGTSIPPECVLPEEALKIESVFKKRATEAMKRASNGDLLLSFSQIAALETNTAAEGVCSKLEKKRLAAKTGLELNEVAIWLEAKRASAVHGNMYRIALAAEPPAASGNNSQDAAADGAFELPPMPGLDRADSVLTAALQQPALHPAPGALGQDSLFEALQILPMASGAAMTFGDLTQIPLQAFPPLGMLSLDQMPLPVDLSFPTPLPFAISLEAPMQDTDPAREPSGKAAAGFGATQ